MQKSEYRTVILEFSSKDYAKGYAGLETALNLHAAEGWRLLQVLEVAGGFSELPKLILVLERPVP